MSVPLETAGYIYNEVLRNTRYLVLSVDSAGRVGGIECPGREWHIEGLSSGEPLPDPFGAVLAAAAGQYGPRLFPYVYADAGQVVDVHVLPDRAGHRLILQDVSEGHEAELKLQQKAHEIALLLERQAELTRQLEISHAEAERASQAKSRFIASMSHEFRTPINSIMGHAGLLAAGNPGSDHPAAIQRASWHLLTLVDNLLEHAREEEGEVQLNPSDVEVAVVLRDMAELFGVQARSRDLKLRIDVPGGDIRLETDELRLRQVLINLLGNALRYTKQGTVTLGCVQSGQTVVFSVADTGPGIRTEDRERIFKPFTRLEASGETGAGLGLTITRRLVEAMGGRLELESEPGKGSTFRFGLPGAAVGAGVARPLEIGGLKALLVDDDADLCAMYEILLSDWGIEVTTAGGCGEAGAKLANGSFDLAIVDLFLEDGSGMELIAGIRDSGFGTRTILTSGSSAESLPGKAVEHGADGFLFKPIRPERLRAEIERLAGQGG